MSQKKRDGVSDGWILFEAWCGRNGGTPIRGGSGMDHVCYKGPLPEDTIDPGDPGTVDVAVPMGGKISALNQEGLKLKMKEAELDRDKADLRYQLTVARITGALKSSTDS